MKFPGYMTASEALENGFTHHGSYYGIPIWIADDGEAPLVEVKFSFLWPAFYLAEFVEALIQELFLHEEPGFLFVIGAEISPPVLKPSKG